MVQISHFSLKKRFKKIKRILIWEQDYRTFKVSQKLFKILHAIKCKLNDWQNLFLYCWFLLIKYGNEVRTLNKLVRDEP